MLAELGFLTVVGAERTHLRVATIQKRPPVEPPAPPGVVSRPDPDRLVPDAGTVSP